MGEPKQLLAIEGRSLVWLAADRAIQTATGPVVVVLGAHADRIAAELRGLPLSATINERWRSGMGSSIRAGFDAALRSDPELEALAIVLCDQPHVTPSALNRLVEARQRTGKQICASSFAGTIGPPVLIDRALFPRVAELADDRGAKHLWLQHPEQLLEIECAEAATDVDTPEDYVRLMTRPPGSPL